MSYRLPRHADGKNDGEVAFGGMNPALYQHESLVIIPNINKHGFWEVAIAHTWIDDVTLKFGHRTAILDTGTVSGSSSQSMSKDERINRL